MLNYKFYYLEIALIFLGILFLCPPAALAIGTILIYLVLINCYRQEQQQIHLTFIMAFILAIAVLWNTPTEHFANSPTKHCGFSAPTNCLIYFEVTKCK